MELMGRPLTAPAWSSNTLANGQLLFWRACYCVEGGLTMLRGCWSWTRYGDTSFGGVLGTGVPLDSPMVAPPQRRNIPVAHAGIPPYALVFNGRSSPALKCPATTRPGPRRRNVFLSRTLPNYFGFHEGNSPTSTPTCGLFTCIVSRGEEENRSRHPHLANRVIARTLFFSEPP